MRLVTILENTSWFNVSVPLPTNRRLTCNNPAMDKLRTYRPRVLVYGPTGMGQGYLGPAILHHLEGFHVQSLDLGSLYSDSTRVSIHFIMFDPADSLMTDY